MYRGYYLGFLFAFLISLTAFGEAGTGSFATLTPSPIHNFYSITDKIFRGERPSSEAHFEYLARIGVKVIINLQGGDYSDNGAFGKYFIPFWEKGETPEEIAREFEIAARYGIQVVSLPINSMKKINKVQAERIEMALKIMNESDEPVYLHCAHGKDRTGLVAALYRMKYQLWSADNAYAEMRRLGHSIVNMITTWPMDEYFFRYARKLARLTGGPEPIVSPLCENNLVF